MSGPDLFVNLMLGTVGSAYLIHGRRESAGLPMVCGALLLLTPYLVQGLTAQLLAGLLLAAFPLLRR